MKKNEGFTIETNKQVEGGFDSAGECDGEFYDQAKKTISDTCNKTTETLNKTYNQAIGYGRANPGKLALLALGSGLVIGLLFANRSRARQGSYVEPVVNALSKGFSDLVRRHWG